jgi:CRP-like cAMP-binding protein
MSIDHAFLRQIPLFATLADEDLAAVARVTTEKQFERGAIIVLEGENGGGLHFVRAGLVKIFKTSAEGKEQMLKLIEPGQTFNDVPALDGKAQPASAAALEPSLVWVTSGRDLRRLIIERPAVAAAAIASLATALRFMVSRVEDLSFRHVTARVAKIVLEQAAAISAGRVQHHLTQQEMAALAGTAREVVGRALKELEQAGAITLQQGQITITNADILRLLA